MPSHPVSLIQGEDRYDNVRRSLELIAAELDLSGKKRVLIKPNFVVTDVPLAATHVEAVRAVLDFVQSRYDGPITIGEGPSMQTAAEGFAAYGYEPLIESHGVRLLDLNHDATVPVQVYDHRLRPLTLSLARTVVDSDYRISVGPPKTHDMVIVTLSLKNTIMGSLISQFTHVRPSTRNLSSTLTSVRKLIDRWTPHWIQRSRPAEWVQFRAMSLFRPSDKMKMHQSYPVINLNLALIAPLVAPHLAVIDGYEAMEGNGPIGGTAVPWRIALSSTDALAADVVCASMMGFDPDEVGYLHYCARMGLGEGDLSRIEVVGNASPAQCTRMFRPHEGYAHQRRWQRPLPKAIRKRLGMTP